MGGAVTGRKFTTYVLMMGIMYMVNEPRAGADTIDTTGQEPYEQCGYCHEYDGNPVMSDFPRLAGQSSTYIVKQLKDFRSGLRKGRMTATAEMLNDQDIETVAHYFNQQAPRSKELPALARQETDRARLMYLQGDPGRGITACATCHGQAGQGVGDIPKLAGQHDAYLVKQLTEFRSGQRINDAGGQMRKIATDLNDEEIRILAGYLARLSAVTAVEAPR